MFQYPCRWRHRPDQPYFVDRGFFLADGRLLSKDAPADEVASSDVIGVVYQIDPERFDPAIADTLGAVHALVLGTKYVKELPDEDAGYYHWGPLGLGESLIGFDKIYGSYELDANYRLADRDIFGYFARAVLAF